MREISGSQMGMKDGLYSEWSWFGQMQIQQMIMAKPLDDATSWVGAYTEIMKEKWDALIPAFKDCPYIEITNDYAGAYVWFKKMGVALGLGRQAVRLLLGHDGRNGAAVLVGLPRRGPGRLLRRRVTTVWKSKFYGAFFQ